MRKILFISLFLLSLSAHKFYVSVSEVRYNLDSSQLEISSRLFVDDLELAIPTLKINGDDDPMANALIEPYLSTHMNIKVNDKDVPLSYLGYEIEDDVVWCYLESSKIDKPNKINLLFKMLMNEFEDQTNIVHFEMDMEIKSVFIKNDAQEGVITLGNEN